MSKLTAKEHIIINAPIEKAHAIIADFKTWKSWSPWLICEPDTKLEFSDDGSFYAWEGKRVGSGQMKILKSTENQIDYDLTFLKPWKSEAKTSFILKSEGDKTHVTWTMDSKWPFYLFFMRKQMQAMIGMDYSRGLKMLKEIIEEGKTHSHLEFSGIESFEKINFIGKKTKTTITDIGKSMSADFENMAKLIENQKIEITSFPFAQYHKFDFVTGKIEYTAGFPVAKTPENLPSEYYFSELGGFSVHKLIHTGKYDHLGNAWAAQMSILRNKEFKQDKKIHPFELYHNNPAETPAEELITSVCFPVRK